MQELKRLHVIHEIEGGRLTGRQGAELLGLSVRQIRRLLRRHRTHGDGGLAHGNRGQPSPRRLDETTRAWIVGLARTQYADYNDCHFTEKLREAPYQLSVSRATVRRLRRAAGLVSPRKRRAPRHRQRRERRSRAGMLLQTDGSRPDWLEGRGPWLTLVAYIDDATNEVAGAMFREEEDAAGYFLGLQDICAAKGLPLAIYADQHTIFQSPAKPTVEQELTGERPKSQFGRLLDELGIELIAALSPQAKGRIERLWGTLQDRLVKALREAHASTAEQAHQVLEAFLPAFNARFAVAPADPEPAYLAWPAHAALDDYFCFKYTRPVANDNTISFDGRRLQIPPNSRRASYARTQVELRHQLDGRLVLRYQSQTLVVFPPAAGSRLRVDHFQPAARNTADRPPVPPPTVVVKPVQSKVPYKPAADHPWRRMSITRKPKQKDETVSPGEQPVSSSVGG